VNPLLNLKRLFVRPGEWHPHILNHYSVWQESKFFYVQTELCEQSDISKHFTQKAECGQFTEADVWDLILQIAPTLNFMHERGVLHMDIKPENIYVTKDNVFKIGDFGLSVAKERWSECEHEGDSEYLAPEVLHDGKIGPAADVFSFGMSLHRLVAGECVHISDLSNTLKVMRKPLIAISTDLRTLISSMIAYQIGSRISLDRAISIACQIQKKRS